MVLTEEENRKIVAGAEEARRRHDAEEERVKTQEFREMKKRNEKKPPEKPIPPVREFIKEKAGQVGQRVSAGVTSFMAAPKPKRQPAQAPRRRAQPSAAPRRRRGAAPRQPQPSRDPFGFGSFGGGGDPLAFSGSLLGAGWGSASKRKKKGGWGLL